MKGRMLFALASTLAGLTLLCPQSEAVIRGPEWIVGIHNAYRRLVGLGEGFTVGNMKKMRWDSVLAQEASDLTKKERLGAPLPEPVYNSMGIPVRGVNMAVVRGHNVNLLRFIHTWYEERKNYDRKYNICHFGKHCENYMQLVSADTDRVGCALRKPYPGDRNPKSVFICVYAPGLNTADPIYKVGERCSLCSRPSAFCELGLCSDCDPHNKEKCECRKTCQTQNGYGVLSKHTCTCHCIYGHGPNCNEQCRNPEMYLDYDICAEVTDDDCRSDDLAVRTMLDEFCPEQCACRALPARN